MGLLIQNVTVGTIEIDDLGLGLVANATINLATEFEALIVATSAQPGGDLSALVTAGTLVVKDPLDDATNLSVSDGLLALRTHNDTHFRMPPGGRIADAIDVDLSAPGTYLRYNGSTFERRTPAQVADEIETEIDITNTTGYNANDHVDWTADQGATNIHIGNIPVALIDHDALLNFVANEHIDWTADQSPTQINAANLPATGNIFETINADTGTTSADNVNDALTVSGGTGVSTAIVGDVLTITNTSPNITHTGQVTGSGALALDVTAITDQPASGAPIGTDTLLINDGGVLSEVSFSQLDTYFNSSLTFADPDQNLFETFAGDTGSTTADTITDTLTIAGGTSITTAVVADVLTITNDSPNATHTGQVTGSGALALDVTAITDQPASGTPVGTDTLLINDGGVLSEVSFTQLDTYFNSSLTFADPDQNLFETFAADTGSTTADTITDTLTVSGGTGVTTAIVADVLTITNSSPNATHTGQVTGSGALALDVTAITDQPASGTPVGTDTLLINDGGVLSEVTFTQLDTYFNSSLNFAAADQNLFATFTGDTGTTTANTTTDTLTVVGGTGISTSIVGDVITITNTIADTDTGITQLTGDVTAGPGNGSQAATITDNAVTNAQLADMAQATFKGRAAGAGTGDPVDLTAAQATAMLDVFTSTLNGLTPLSGGGTANFLRADGTWAAPADSDNQNLFATFTGDTGTTTADTETDTLTIAGGTGISTAVSGDTVTITNSSPNVDQNLWATITANTGTTTANVVADTLTVSGSGGIDTAVSGDTLDISLSSMPAGTFKGRPIGGGFGAPLNLSSTQATAMLDVFTSTLKGLVPLSGGGTTNFLRADGTWAATAGGVTSVTGTANQITSSPTTGAVVLSVPTQFIIPGSIQVTTRIHESINSSVTAAGTTSGTATAVSGRYNVVTTVAAGTGIRLPVPTSPFGRSRTIFNRGANPLNVYPQTGGNIGTAAANIPVVVPAGQEITFVSSSATQHHVSEPVIQAGAGVTVSATPGTLTIASSVGAGSVDKRMNTWTLLSGNLYYNDFVHNLGTTKVAVHLREFADNRQVEAEYTTIVDANTVRVVVNGNGEDLVTNVISGTGPTGATGPAGAGVATIQDEGVSLTTSATALNFVGAGVVASGTGTTKTITIAGGTTGVVVQDEGTPLATNGTTLNFVGSAVTATGTGATKTISVTSPTYSVPATNATAVGRIVSAQVDTNAVGFGAPLYMAADGNFDTADADFEAQMPARAIAVESGTGVKQLLLEGFIRNDAWSWTPGACVYISTTAGTMTQTQPSGSGDQVQKIGFAWSATVVYFSPGDYTIIEVA